MKSRSLRSLLTTCLLLTVLLAACMPGLAANATEEGYTLPIVTEPITLRLLGRESETAGTSFNADAVPLIFQEYEKATGIIIDFEALPSAELKETAQLRLAARQDIPDLMIIPGEQDGSYLSKYLNDGVVVNLKPYLEQYGMHFKKVIEEYPAYLDAISLPDGSIVGLANVNASQYGFRAQLIRQDWLDKLGLSMPTTPEELLEVAKAFIANDMNGNGQPDEIGMSGYGTQFMELGHAWGLHFVTGDGWDIVDEKIVYEPVTEAYREFLKYIKECVAAGVFPADWISVDKATHLARVANDQIGILMRESAANALHWQSPDNSMKKSLPDANWQVIPAMDGPYGKGIFIKEAIGGIWRTLVMTSANKYPEETVKWLDYVIYSEEANIQRQFGLEGQTYEVVDGKIMLMDSPLNNNQPQADGSWLGTGDYLPQVYTTMMEEVKLAKLNLPEDNAALQGVRACFPYVQEPFVVPIPTVEVGARISSLRADIDTYVDEMCLKFITGETDLDTGFDTYIANLKSIGLDEVISLYQQQYDTFKANQN